MATINRKTRNQFNLNSTRIRFDVKKLTPVSESICMLISNKSKIYFNPFFLHDNDNWTEKQTLR